jgi:Na+-translocating ferredoxin:NAD+ oxidoreductase RnfD subunit
MREATRRFFRTPKGLLTIVLILLVIAAALGSGFMLIAPGVIAAALAAMAVDAPLLRWREKRWEFPSGALLTGLLVAMVLSPHEPWYVAAITAAVGVASKYVARTRSANIFNPAALALVATFYIFDTGQSWWGALPELPTLAIVLLFASGVFITDRVNKMPLVLAFLGVYYLLGTLTAFIGNPAGVAELYRAPDLHAALFFAFFMVTDPPTSPPKYREQIVYGVIVAVVSVAVFELVGAAYFLLAGLLVANVWEAWRRSHTRKHRAVRVPTDARPQPAGAA